MCCFDLLCLLQLVIASVVADGCADDIVVLRLQPYQHHHVVVTGLKPGTQYFYRVGDATDGFSSVLSFTSAPSYDVTSFSVVRAARGVLPHKALPTLPSLRIFRLYSAILALVRKAMRLKRARSLTARSARMTGSFTLATSATRVCAHTCLHFIDM